MKMSLTSMLLAVICGFALLLGAPSILALGQSDTADLQSIVLAMDDDDDTDTDEEEDDTDEDEEDTDEDEDEDDTDEDD